MVRKTPLVSLVGICSKARDKKAYMREYMRRYRRTKRGKKLTKLASIRYKEKKNEG